jgi:membrane protein
MDLLRPVRAFDRRQQHSRWLSFPVAVLKKFGDDQASGLAALIAYYAFFSLFPLLLVFVTVLGFVLQGNPSAQEKISDSVLAQFPVIGGEVKGHTLQGHGLVLAIGAVTAILAGLAITTAAQNAFNRVWAVPFKQRPNFFVARGKGLGLLVLLGGLFVVATASSGLVTGGLGGTVVKLGAYVLSLGLNFALVIASFKLLTSIELPVRALVWGSAFGAVALELLQVLGTVYIDHVVKKSKNTYGTFALVIGVLVWLHLGGQITLVAAEINVVRARRLWPRSLLGPPATAADEEALRDLAEVEERYEEEQVEVEFEEPPPTEWPDGGTPGPEGATPAPEG